MTSDLTLGARQLLLTVDRDAMARFGVTMDTVRTTLYSAFGTRKIATVFTPSNDYAVILEADKAGTLDPTVLSKVFIKSNSGQQIRFDTMATVKLGAGSGLGGAPKPTSGRDHHLQPFSGIYARRGRHRHARRQSRRSTCPASITGQFAGTAQVFESSFRDQPLLIAAADPRHLHRARHLVRELHPSHHYPVGSAVR